MKIGKMQISILILIFASVIVSAVSAASSSSQLEKCSSVVKNQNGGYTNVCENVLTNPNIVSMLPFNKTVQDQVFEKRTFIVVSNQEVNVLWLINGTEVFNDTGKTRSSYINESAEIGTWNVTAIVSNNNGTDNFTWDWTVIPTSVVKVDINNFAFNPANISIIRGTTVIWTNDDSVSHTVTSDTNIFNSGVLNPGQTFEWTFDDNGSFNYHCSIHTFMHGEVNVTSLSTRLPISPPIDNTTIGLDLIAQNLTAPLGLVSPQDGTGRLFIVDQIGVINILTADGQILSEPFLNLSSSIVTLNPRYDERGLLGLAFHPNFNQNGRFYVYYSVPLRPGAPVGWSHTNRISEFKVLQGNPNKADPTTEKILLEIDKPESNHNAGSITFGPDGYLYIPTGDGGGGNDVDIGHPPPGNAQNISTLLGKILRIDVDNITKGKPYAIPPDNPFIGSGLDEIFAYGLRNPWRISFDAGGNHSLIVGDVGQNFWEESDIISKGGNYGWNIKEGTHCFDPNNPNLSPESCSNTSPSGQSLTDPIIDYANAGQTGGIGIAIIGGYIYRGKSLPDFNGAYIFGDLSKGFSEGNGSLFVGRPPVQGETNWSMKEVRISTSVNGRIGSFVRSFGQDADNELYVLTSQNIGPTGNTGQIFKLGPKPVRSVNLSVDKNTKSTNVNINATYVLTLNNTGTNHDTFNISIQNPQNAVAGLSRNNIDLGAGKNTTFLLNVTNTTTGVFVINVTATSLADSNANSTVTTTTTVSSSPNKINATIDIEPKTLNLKSKGKFTAFISLPSDFNINNINLSTVKCEGAPAISLILLSNNNGALKFNRQDLVNISKGDDILTVTGKVSSNGSFFDFQGNDKIRVK